MMVEKLDIEDRIFRTSQQDCFCTLKDHKKNFREKPSVRTLNPAKPELGRISIIRQNSELEQWKHTLSVIKWFKKIPNKKNLSFIIFDVEKFYPSIDRDLLLKALNGAENMWRCRMKKYKLLWLPERQCSTWMVSPGPKKGGTSLMWGWGSLMGQRCVK